MPIGTDMKNVERAEEALGVRLPPALRFAYTLANRRLEIEIDDETWWTFPVFDPEFAAKTVNHLVHENQGEQQWARFPAHALAIADDGSGNRLTIVVRGSEPSDEIHVWDHETRELSTTGVTVEVVLAFAREYAERIDAFEARWPRMG